MGYAIDCVFVCADAASGAVLGRMPDAQDRHQVRTGDPIDDKIGRHDHQLTRTGLAPGPATVGKYRQTVTSEQKFATHALGCNRIVGRDVANDSADIGQRPGTPDDRQWSVRLGRRDVELALGEPQKPDSDLLMLHRSWISVRLGYRRRENAGLRFVIFDQGGWRCHASRIAHRRPGCIPAIPRRCQLPLTLIARAKSVAAEDVVKVRI